jgi:hypothetical protein
MDNYGSFLFKPNMFMGCFILVYTSSDRLSHPLTRHHKTERMHQSYPIYAGFVVSPGNAMPASATYVHPEVQDSPVWFPS